VLISFRHVKAPITVFAHKRCSTRNTGRNTDGMTRRRDDLIDKTIASVIRVIRMRRSGLTFATAG
jgi:hypothetical protein